MFFLICLSTWSILLCRTCVSTTEVLSSFSHAIYSWTRDERRTLIFTINSNSTHAVLHSIGAFSPTSREVPATGDLMVSVTCGGDLYCLVTFIGHSFEQSVYPVNAPMHTRHGKSLVGLVPVRDFEPDGWSMSKELDRTFPCLCSTVSQ